MNIPFQAIEWSTVDKTEHRGAEGTSWWQTLQYGDLRIRLVEYSAGYLADHWCRKGHIVHCLSGSFVSELQDGRSIRLTAGDSYIVSDELSSHRSVSKEAVKLLIIDGAFLKWKSAGLLPEHMETERLLLDVIRIDDSAFLHELVNSPGWLRYIGNRNVHGEADAVAYIQRMLLGPGSTVHVVRLKETGGPIGTTTLIQRAWLPHPDIGYALLPAFEGKGFAHEASNALLQHLQAEAVVPEVLAITLPDNERSVRLLERLGLAQDRRETIDGEELLIFRKKL